MKTSPNFTELLPAPSLRRRFLARKNVIPAQGVLKNFKSVLLSVSLLLLGVIPGLAQSAAISYRGHLTAAGNPVNSPHDMQFKLFDTAAVGAGAQQGGTITEPAVPVANGVFTVTLDFGGAVFDGSPRFLEIGVRPGGSAGAYTTLAPRQQVASVPYALRSLTTGTAETAATATTLVTGAAVQSLNNLKDNVTLAAGPNVTITPSGNTLTIASTGGSSGGSDLWSAAANNAYYNAGNVGIGTSTPAHRLSLDGGPTWTANGWLGAIDLPNASAIAWQANAAGQRFGMGHSFDGFYLFRTASDPGTAGSPALYDFVVNDVGNVGIGTITPSARLQVNGGWNGEQGALQLSGHRPTLRFTGDADSGNESWLLHLGDAGPLGFYRRTGPKAWSPVMQLTTSGRQMEIYGQDALGLIGFQPFLTLFDTSAGNAASRIQAAGGDLFLEPASYIAGQLDTGLVVKNGTGFVGIGTTAPVAKLHAQTPLANTAAVYGRATGSGGVGVYGQSTSGPAIHADGNATQARDKGGFVKAMAYIDPFLPAGQYVVRCYNSQQTGNAVSAAPCGITATKVSQGRYEIHFGFNVQDRFISVMLQDSRGTAFTEVTQPNRVTVMVYNIFERFYQIDSAFTIFVF